MPGPRAAARQGSAASRPTRRRVRIERPARRRRADLRPAVRLERRAVVERAADRTIFARSSIWSSGPTTWTKTASSLSGVSDGGTGAYYAALRDTTPFASFLPLNGFIMVLQNETVRRPTAISSQQPAEQADVHRQRRPRSDCIRRAPSIRYVAHLKKSGVDLDYRPQPNAGARHVVVAADQGPVRAVRRRSPAPPAARYADAGRAARPRSAEPGALAGDRSSRAQGARPDDPALAGREPDGDAPRARTSASAAPARASIASAKGRTPSRSGSSRATSCCAINNQPASAGTDVAEVLRSLSGRTAADSDGLARRRDRCG